MAATATERKLFVDGEWIETGDWLEVRSPYSGDVVGRVAKAGADETRRAIDAAERAMREPLPAHKRAEILVRVAGALGRRHEEAARLISDEAGKPLKAARVEASRAMSTYTFAAVEARKLAGEMVPMDAAQAGEGKLAFTLRRPIGVVGAISPFNFPLNLVAHKIAPALAAGCAVVLKPASQTPMSALLLAELEEEAGLPAGLAQRARRPGVRDRGRPRRGRARQADHLHGLERRRLEAEGARAEEAREPRARQCHAADRRGRRGRVDGGGEGLAERVRLRGAELHLRAAGLRGAQRVRRVRAAARPVGRSAEGRATRPTRTRTSVPSSTRTRASASSSGSRRAAEQVLTGGELEGELIRPTVIANPAPDDEVSCEEVFGPVCTVTAVDSIDEAIRLANSTATGCRPASSPASLDNALRAAQELEFGGVTVNEAPTFRSDQMPYGGVKDSGNTREGPHYAVREMTEERLVVVDLP